MSRRHGTPADLVDRLDATATLAVAEAEVVARRRQGVDRLLLLLHWADLHSEDPQARPGAVPLSRGGDRLVRLGGAGTPTVSELCWAELAIALEVGVVSLRNQAGQALDLRHRMRLVWALFKDLRIEPWVAQRVATITRPLTAEQAALVDAAVAAAVEESPGRILHIAEAKTIEADLEGYRARLAADDRRTGVWLSRPRPGDLVAEEGEPGTRRLSSKLSAAAAVEGNAMVDDLADALALHGDHDPDSAGVMRRPGTSYAPRRSRCCSPTRAPPQPCSTSSTPRRPRRTRRRRR